MGVWLQARGISKKFDAVQALDRVDLEVREGEVHALVGENGAGKSTFGKVLAGVVQPDAGEIQIAGRPVQFGAPMDAQRSGVSIIFQELDLFPNLTVAENVVIGNLAAKKHKVGSPSAAFRFAEPFLRQVGLDVGVSTRLGDLPIGQIQLAAIARSLSMGARLIVMDEPTSSLGDEAVAVLFEQIRNLTAQGVSIVYVSHKMDEIQAVADRVTVFRDGRHVATTEMAQTNLPTIVAQMVGRELSLTDAVQTHAKSDVLLSVRELRTARLQSASFDLFVGEVLGVAGLVGSGRSELGAALFGLDPILGGSVSLKGKPFRPTQPSNAIRQGLGLLPEDRKTQGLLMQGTVRENTSLASLNRYASVGVINQQRESAAMGPIHGRTRLKASSYEAPVTSLSGGNQQKVMLGKWLLVDPDVLFLDEPTRGIDIGAKADVYDLIAECAAAGKGVLFVSSELPELLRCSDRVLVMHEGRAVATLNREEATQDRIMGYATGLIRQGES